MRLLSNSLGPVNLGFKTPRFCFRLFFNNLKTESLLWCNIRRIIS